jgi:hypothetical protein
MVFRNVCQNNSLHVGISFSNSIPYQVANGISSGKCQPGTCFALHWDHCYRLRSSPKINPYVEIRRGIGKRCPPRRRNWKL